MNKLKFITLTLIVYTFSVVFLFSMEDVSSPKEAAEKELATGRYLEVKQNEFLMLSRNLSDSLPDGLYTLGLYPCVAVLIWDDNWIALGHCHSEDPKVVANCVEPVLSYMAQHTEPSEMLPSISVLYQKEYGDAPTRDGVINGLVNKLQMDYQKPILLRFGGLPCAPKNRNFYGVNVSVRKNGKLQPEYSMHNSGYPKSIVKIDRVVRSSLDSQEAIKLKDQLTNRPAGVTDQMVVGIVTDQEVRVYYPPSELGR